MRADMSHTIHYLTPTLPIHTFDAPSPGPTVLIQAGIHGDEIAGVHALQELLEDGVHPHRGRLIIIPIMNPAAYRIRQRKAPGGEDLNRCFPGDADSSKLEHRLARQFMDLVVKEQPALVATLHESHKRFDPTVQPSFGQTLVYGVEPIPDVLNTVVDRLNTTLQNDNERWATQLYPVATSSTEVIVDHVGCVGVCVETWMGFPEHRRIEMHRQVVRLFLDAFQVLPLDAPLVPPSSHHDEVRP